MKTRSLYRLPMAILAIACIATAIATASARDDYDSRAAKRKAEYIILEAQTAYANEEYDRYLKLVERAYELDSLNPEILGEWALMIFNSDEADSLTTEKAYEAFRTNYLAAPDNYFNGTRFANLAARFGRYDDAIATLLILEQNFPKNASASQLLAETYLDKFQADSDTIAFNKAMEIYDRFELGGKSEATIANKISAYYIKGDTAAIIDQLNQLDSVAPGDCHIAWFIGSAYEVIGSNDLALEYYGRSIDIDSTFGPSYKSRAKLYIEMGDTLAFEREVEQAMKSPSLELESKLSLLRGYLSEMIDVDDKAAAIDDIFNSLLDQYPGETTIPGLYCAYLMIAQRTEDAIEQVKSLMLMTPDDPDVYSSLMSLYEQSGDSAAFIDISHLAIEKFPDDLSIPMRLASHYVNKEDYARAIEVYDSVVIDTVHNPQAVSFFYTFKGDILAAAGDTVRALDTYDMAIELDPDNNLALNNAAYFGAISGGDLDKAERYSLRSLKDNDLNYTYLDTYAWILYLKKDYLMAKMYIDIAINSLEDESLTDEFSDLTDDTVTETDDPDENVVNTEVEIVEDEANTKNGHPDIYAHAGDIYYMNGDAEKALYYWQRAAEIDPEYENLKEKIENPSPFFE